MIEEDAGYHRDISLELAKIMRNLLPGKEIEKNLKRGWKSRHWLSDWATGK